MESFSDFSYNQPKFCPSATWNPNAISFKAGSWGQSKPRSVFVDRDNDVYATCTDLNFIEIWRKGKKDSPTQFWGWGFERPSSIFVSAAGEMFIDNSQREDGVERWSADQLYKPLPVGGKHQSKRPVVLKVDEPCFGLSMDTNNNLYCSLRAEHKVVQRSLETNNQKLIALVAGDGSRGSSSTTLSGPCGIFVDRNFTLYVADTDNNRLQKFLFGTRIGTTVAGNSSKPPVLLNMPTGVILDADGNLFITDSGNNRVIASGPTGFRCIVGCSRVSGLRADQLSNPGSLSFDPYGNIYVADTNGNRIQKFVLASNSCSKCSCCFGGIVRARNQLLVKQAPFPVTRLI